MSNRILNLPFGVLSEDEKLYKVDLWRPNVDDLRIVWDQYSRYKVLFSDVVLRDFNHFTAVVLSRSTVVLEVSCERKRIGLLYATDITMNGSALVHFIFWDRKTKGRQRLILAVLQWGMDELELHKVNMTVPVYAYAALHRIHKMGIRIEGRRLEAILFDGKWRDVLEFGILRSELTDEVITAATLPRLDHELRWHGLLNNDPLLMRKVLRVKNERTTRPEDFEYRHAESGAEGPTLYNGSDGGTEVQLTTATGAAVL
jgi:hypothetical protein